MGLESYIKILYGALALSLIAPSTQLAQDRQQSGSTYYRDRHENPDSSRAWIRAKNGRYRRALMIPGRIFAMDPITHLDDAGSYQFDFGFEVPFRFDIMPVSDLENMLKDRIRWLRNAKPKDPYIRIDEELLHAVQKSDYERASGRDSAVLHKLEDALNDDHILSYEEIVDVERMISSSGHQGLLIGGNAFHHGGYVRRGNSLVWKHGESTLYAFYLPAYVEQPVPRPAITVVTAPAIAPPAAIIEEQPSVSFRAAGSLYSQSTSDHTIGCETCGFDGRPLVLKLDGNARFKALQLNASAEIARTEDIFQKGGSDVGSYSMTDADYMVDARVKLLGEELALALGLVGAYSSYNQNGMIHASALDASGKSYYGGAGIAGILDLSREGSISAGIYYAVGNSPQRRLIAIGRLDGLRFGPVEFDAFAFAERYHVNDWDRTHSFNGTRAGVDASIAGPKLFGLIRPLIGVESIGKLYIFNGIAGDKPPNQAMDAVASGTRTAIYAGIKAEF